MDWIKKNPEKIVAIIAGLIGLGLGAKEILEVMAFPDKFVVSKAPAKAELPTPENDVVLQSAAILKAPFNWSDKAVELGSGARKLVPLFRSVTIIEKDGRLFDLADPTEDPIRPPVENTWFIKYNLDYLFSGVLEADQDADGFSSVDEWRAKTSPIDPASHPPYWHKLMYVDRKQRNFSIKFAADNDPKFQINISDQNRPTTKMVLIGDTFYEGRFTALSYEKKEGLNKVGIRANQSILKLKDHSIGADLTLVFGEVKDYPTYFAEFNFTLDPNQKQFYAQVGKSFTLDKEPTVSYKLEDIDPTGASASLKLADGEIIRLEKGVLPTLPEPK